MAELGIQPNLALQARMSANMELAAQAKLEKAKGKEAAD